jgi:hypothetical protein
MRQLRFFYVFIINKEEFMKMKLWGRNKNNAKPFTGKPNAI